jgi:hypothetical protein
MGSVSTTAPSRFEIPRHAPDASDTSATTTPASLTVAMVNSTVATVAAAATPSAPVRAPRRESATRQKNMLGTHV